MKIGIVLHPYGEEKPSGLGHYILELAQNILAIDQKNTYLIFTKSVPKASPALPGNNWRIVPLGFGRFWRDIGFIFAPKADVYLFVMPVLPFFFKLKNTITITHDFPYHYIKPDTVTQKIIAFFLHYIHKYSLKKADKIVAISEYTRNEDLKLFGVSPEKIEVIYNGFRNVCNAPPADLNIDCPYFLTVGAVKERKNTLRIVEAFDEFKKKNASSYKLIIVGKTSNPYSQKVQEYIAEHNLQDDVVFFGHTKDPQLSYLYRHAAALIFPSTIESFGFPVLEAMSCGLPVITSKTGGVSEVVNDAALRVNPESVPEIAEALSKIVSEPALREELIKRGYRRAQDFSWSKTARQFLALMENMVRNSLLEV